MRLTRLRIAALVLLSVVAATALGIMVWSNASIIVDETQPDPAVLLANEIGSGDIAYTEGYVGTVGQRIHYVTAGEGEPIIFVHGFPSYWFTMFGLMEEFKLDYQVIAIDGLGTGRSDAPGDVEAYGIETLISAIDRVVTELDLGDVHLVGHDWGVALTTGYAQANPDKVKSLTAMSALPHNIVLSRIENDPSHQELFSYTDEFARANPALIRVLGIKDQLFDSIYQPFLDDGLITEAQAERFRQDIGNPRRLNRFIHWYRANFPDTAEITDDDFWPSRSTPLTVPAVLIYGDEDPVVTDRLVEDFLASADDLEVVVLAGVGHRPHFEQKDDVVEMIRDLIADAN
ncbi:MAG: alpha/beta hydrolase [Pseudomonadota bacterium]